MSGLDPEDWNGLRALGHRMLDDMIDRLVHLREQPVWQHMPDALRAELRAPLPEAGMPAEAVYEDFQRLVAPYSVGNTHPRFMGWVHGGGTGIGMLADLLAGGLNANLGGRDHAPIEVERQVVRWAAEMVGMPSDSSGLLVTGSSMANLIAVLVARRHVRRSRGAHARRRRRQPGRLRRRQRAWLHTARLRHRRPRHRGAAHHPVRRKSADGRRRPAPDCRARPRRRRAAVPGGGHRRDGGYRRHRRPLGTGGFLRRREAVVPCRRRLRGAGRAVAAPAPGARGDRARRQPGVRLP